MTREAARAHAAAGLRLNRQSGVPVHAQLKTQICHLISTGALRPGMRLPTVRQLAGFLRINRNTAARALADLHRDGFLRGQPGRGTFVTDEPPARPARAARSLEQIADDALERARRLGFTYEEVVATIAGRAPERSGAAAASATRALLVECNWAELTRYRDDLERELPLRVDRLLVEELPARVAGATGVLRDYGVVITTFFHVHEVKRAMPPGAPPVVALLSEANIATLLRLTELVEGTTVGLVCNTSTGSQNLLRSVQSAGLWHLSPVLASTDDPWSIDQMLERTRTVVCSELAASQVGALLPPDAELIVSDRTLDRGGLDMLRDLLDRLPDG